MKYLNKITLGLILCMGLMTSCKDDDEIGIPGGIAVDREEITIVAEGGTEKIAVSSNSNWVSSSSQPWISISPANGLGSADCSLAIDSTLSEKSREAQIRFSVEGQESKSIRVIQFGYGKQIILKEPTVEIESSARYDDRYFDAVISANVAFKIDSNVEYSFEGLTDADNENELESDRTGWIEMPKADDLEINLDRGYRPRTVKVRFKWKANIVPCTRVAKIRLLPKNADEQLIDNEGNPTGEVILTVKQKPALRITDDRAGDSIAILAINEKVQSMINFDSSESMLNWNYVKLWEATDKLPNGDKNAIGRVRSVQFMLIDLKDGETLPKEVRHLKYLESFTIQSNANWQIRNISLGEEICELKHLKELSVYALGLEKLSENFIKLGGKVDDSYVGLEALNLASNGFNQLSDITNVVNQENFPNLTALSLTGCRRVDIIKDLSQISGTNEYNGKKVGLHINLDNPSDKSAFMKLLTWDSLRELSLSYNYIEGELPDDDYITNNLTIKSYQESDFFTEDELKAEPSIYLTKISADTCGWLKTMNKEVIYQHDESSTSWKITGQDVPRVLPNARAFSFNLNYLTGALPKWILFHPYFVEWSPETFIFAQEDEAKDSKSQPVGFNNIDNVKFDYKYYYGTTGEKDEEGVAYPLYYKRYVAN
ncbi:leucine Rich repeat-containing domain protein [Bacteroides clarus CAG:160]|uniref:BACON domain-containing protein n=1 Tax=Bacteroides TaxID=816 RepID=UPI00033F4419|nr:MULTISPECIES: BACON domain-containing protein [Bacteroides]CDB81310.1 leucine Rich repeat-containing domain protein [Bacteroides clarus CAG:160]